MNKSVITMKKTILSLLVGCTLQVNAQQPLSIEQLLNFKKVGTPAVSLDGVAMCFYIENTSIEKNKGNKDLYLNYTSNEDIEPVQLTNTPDFSEYAPQFNKSGSHVYFLSNESE